MPKHINKCGVRNGFGYFDSNNKSIILKHPYFKKSDLEDVISWLASEDNLQKFSLNIGTLENMVIDNANENLYGAARNIILKALEPSKQADNDMLKTLLIQLKNQKNLQNLILKCYIFSEDNTLFETLITTITNISRLMYLDLGGCYFSEEQLIKLAETIKKSHIAHLVWPEPIMSEQTSEKVQSYLRESPALVVLEGVPMSYHQITAQNRAKLFACARHPSTISANEAKFIQEYGSSARAAVAFEKQRLYELEKNIEGLLA